MKIHLKNVKMDESVDLDVIIKKTEGYSGADITNVCREAAYMPMRRKLKNEGGFKNIVDLKKFEEEVNIPLQK
jgi:katanin p60 ATPase-containing subunit A1